VGPQLYSRVLSEVPPAELLKQMVLKGPSAFDVLFTYESAIIANLKNMEGRWGGVRVVYPRSTSGNDNRSTCDHAMGERRCNAKAPVDFVAFLMTEPIQRELLKYGFRPRNPMSRPLDRRQSRS